MRCGTHILYEIAQSLVALFPRWGVREELLGLGRRRGRGGVAAGVVGEGDSEFLSQRRFRLVMAPPAQVIQYHAVLLVHVSFVAQMR